jgi:TPR repeat protein
LTASAVRHFAEAMLTFSLCSEPASAAAPEDGRRAYDAGHFTDAMGIWSELSRQGNAQADFGLGLMLDLGNGTPEDPERAFLWYKRAADAGLPAAQFNVAAMYDSGRGIARDYESAALWYARAAAHGHHRAQFDLGLLYEQGNGVPHNLDAAASWLRDAADGGLPAAAVRLKALAPTAAKRVTSDMTAVTLVWPPRDATLTLTDDNPTLELVWAAPPEPQPVHYEIQVRELGGPALRTMFTASVTETATVVRLPANEDFYVWNVDAVERNGARAPGDWGWFSIGPPPRSEDSVAAMPEASRPDH